VLAKLLLTAFVVGAVILYFRWLKANPNKPSRNTVMKYGAVAAIALLVLLAAAGRLNWLFALIGSLLVAGQRLLPLLKFAPLAQRLYARHRASQQTGGPAGGQSRVRTAFVVMTLDHDSGEMDGEVIAGTYAGKRLGELSLHQLLQLLEECERDDREAVDLVEAYLDRTQGPDWRTRAGEPGGRREERPAPGRASMTPAEAYEILGLEPGAPRDQVVDAHRRLMQRIHPDRGGSAYLASAINRAKDILLANIP